MLCLSVGCSPEQPTGGPDDLQRPTLSPTLPEATPTDTRSPNNDGGGGDGVPGAEPLPIQHFMLVGREYDTVTRAVVVLAQKCMDAQGFDLVIPQPQPARGPLVDISIRRYGSPETLADAREVGFGIPARNQPDPAVSDQLADWDQRLTDAQRVALTGPRDAVPVAGRRNGCLGEADRRLMGESSIVEASGLAQSPLVKELNQDPRSTDSEASRAATQRFAECMSAAGYPEVDRPLSERPDRFRSGDPQQPSEAEKEAAVTQFGCFEESQVREAMRVAEVAFQTAAIEANPEAFAQVRQELDAVVHRATEVLGES